MFKYLRLLTAVTVASIASLAASGEQSEAVAATCASATARPGATLCLINVQRAQPRVARAATERKAVAGGPGPLARHGREARLLLHTTPDGLSFAERIRGTGYLRASRRWFVGENLAGPWRGRDSARRIVRAWMHSPPHREVMLNPAFREVGIGIASGVPRPLPPGGADYRSLTSGSGESDRNQIEE